MRIKVVKIGKPSSPHFQPLVERYRTRLQPHWKIESVEMKGFENQTVSLSDLTALKGLSQPSHLLITLDERGKQLSSPEFAGKLQSWVDNPATKAVSFIVGGPYGLSQELVGAAHFSWSLSPAVFPSDLAWLMVWEQLYRATTILKGTGYHHA